MLDPNQPLSKPWLEKSSKDPLARIAYCLTYFVILLGVAGGAVRCYLDYINVPMLEEQGNLCVVVDEDFSRGDEGGRLFGDNGLFFREVDMSGFGYVFLLLFLSLSLSHILTSSRLIGTGNSR